MAEIAKISLLILTSALLDNYLFLHAHCNCRPSVFIEVQCIARQANRNGEIVKHFYNCIKVLSQFRTPYCTHLWQYSKRPKRGGAHDNVQIPNLQFRFQFLRQKIVSAYNITAVCCNNHVQENMHSSNRFTSIQGKTYLGFQNLGCHCKILGCHFDTQKRLKKTLLNRIRVRFILWIL